jgi:hypothetical protein
VIEAIGAATGAETIVRREPGVVGPIDLGPALPGEVLRELAGRNTLVVTTRSGALQRIILVARGERDDTAPPKVTPATPDEPREEAGLDHEEGIQPQGQVPEPVSPQLLRRIAELGAGDGNSSDVMELEDTYYSSQSIEMRRAVLVALARLHTPESIDLVERLGLGDADAEIRLFAARALYRTIGEQSRTTLQSAAAAEVDPTVRREILALIGGS